MKADLHVHTDVSDGSLTIVETLTLAKKNGLTQLAITDHDTVDGVQQAIHVGALLGIEVIPGIEISAADEKTGKVIHILGYNFKLAASNITKLCQPLLMRRQEHSLWQITQLHAHGYQIDAAAISAQRGGKTIYKQHIMAQLIKAGYTTEIYSDLYQQLFKGSGICAGKFEYVDAVAAVKAIKADGGIAVLAHPGAEDVYYIIDELISAGLDGIELYHEKHTQEDHAKIIGLADKKNLMMTGGSDFHGRYGAGTKLGELLCPDEMLTYFQNQEDNLFSFIKDIAYQAGRKLRMYAFKPKSISLKENEVNNLVTDFDLAIERFIINKIKDRFPDHGFITEENTIQSSGKAEYTWIIDPIDGTTNFVSFSKDFAVSIALYKNQQPYMGAVYDVMADKLYQGVVQKGAWLNGSPLAKIPSSEKLADAIVDCSLNSIHRLKEEHGINLPPLIKHIRGHRALGAASLAICNVACGQLSAYISANLRIWDCAAAAIILCELQGDYCILNQPENLLEAQKKLLFIACKNKALLKELIDKLYEGKDQELIL